MRICRVVVVGRRRVLHFDQANDMAEPLGPIGPILGGATEHELTRSLQRIEEFLERSVAILGVCVRRSGQASQRQQAKRLMKTSRRSL
jgi:hypothetical protein